MTKIEKRPPPVRGSWASPCRHWCSAKIFTRRKPTAMAAQDPTIMSVLFLGTDRKWIRTTIMSSGRTMAVSLVRRADTN